MGEITRGKQEAYPVEAPLLGPRESAGYSPMVPQVPTSQFFFNTVS